MKSTTAKIMPHSLEAEQSVLAAMLIDNEVPLSVLSKLSGDDFYSDAHKKIYETMQALNRNNVPIDFVTVVDLLEKNGELENVGSIDYITYLTNVIPSSANFKNYVDIVKRDSVLRNLINCGQKIVENSYTVGDKKEALGFAEKLIFDLSQNEDQTGLEHIGKPLQQVIEKFNIISKDPQALKGLSTGFTDLDKVTNGLQKSDLILLAARPGVGKTSFAMNIVNNVALSNKKYSCAVFPLEMPATQLAQRSICSVANVSMEKALKGQLSIEEWKSVMAANKKLANANIYIDDSSVNTPIDILSKCRRLKRERGLDLVMIDYLQLMSSGSKSKSDNRQQEISEMTRALKIAARELDVPIIVLSQLSRAVETRSDHRPVLSDLRESGSIEQDADIVMFLYKSEMYNDVSDSEPGICEGIIAKHRNGPLANFKLRWIGETTSFANLSDRPKRVETEDNVPPPMEEEYPIGEGPQYEYEEENSDIIDLDDETRKEIDDIKNIFDN